VDPGTLRIVVAVGLILEALVITGLFMLGLALARWLDQARHRAAVSPSAPGRSPAPPAVAGSGAGPDPERRQSRRAA
jgi:hypothetical protein